MQYVFCSLHFFSSNKHSSFNYFYSCLLDKVLLYFAIGDPSGLGLNLGGVRDAITRLGSGINIRVYVNAFVPGVYETIATVRKFRNAYKPNNNNTSSQDGRAGVVPLNINMLPTSVAGFYSIPTNQTPSNRISLGRANAGSGKWLVFQLGRFKVPVIRQEGVEKAD